MWQKLEKMRPALPRHIHIQPRDFRGERWYLLHDKSNGRFHRLSPSAWQLVRMMDGRRNLSQILSAVSTALAGSGEEPPTQREFIELLQYLHVADLLVCDIPPDTQELFARQQHKQQQKWTRLLRNPVSWKITLGNPDRLLNHLAGFGSLISSPFMGLLWLLLVGYALLQAGSHWTELTAGSLTSLLSPGNMLLLWLTYPLLKVVHELGHALFTKAWGGNVHECGMVFVLGTPLPYVDATAATAFVSKRRRLMVSAAGMAVELFIAALALLLWLVVEDGLFRNILYNLIILGSISTLLFNGNPLLKFDGYHLLCDAIETPNLSTRANQQFAYLVQRYIYGFQGLYSPAAKKSEAMGLAVYAVAAAVYRLLIFAIIIYLIADFSLSLGIIMGLWLLTFQLIIPSIKGIRSLFRKNRLAQPKRAMGITACAFGLTVAGIFYLPLPHTTHTEGVLWLPAENRIRAQAAGEIAELLVSDGETVTKDQVLMTLSNPALINELKLRKATLQEFQARYQSAWSVDRSRVNLLLEDIAAIEAEIAHLQERVNNLSIRSPGAGKLNFTETHRLEGSYLNRGDTVGFIVKPEAPRVRVALTQQEIGLVRAMTQQLDVRFANNIGDRVNGKIIQQVPQATFTLPSPVLGTRGGGKLAVVADDKTGGVQSENMVFLLDVALPQWDGKILYGERAYVRFQHPPEPLARQLLRPLQQLFISTLDH